ncbi:MAG: biotin carboxyl carrier domain-containing protein [Armatimonadetes bacterium]|nr:biotin carboxyl carrier domain-containing protein [Armatimonadota bacterium]
MNEDPQLIALRRLSTLMRRYRLLELEVREGGLTIRMRAHGAAGEPSPAPNAFGARPAAAIPSRPTGPPLERLHTLVAPLTGTFYRSSSPAAPPFVEVGSTVEPGQTVGLIEAMKLFSEVPADCSGTVYAIHAGNGRLVQQGEPLMAVLLPEA